MSVSPARWPHRLTVLSTAAAVALAAPAAWAQPGQEPDPSKYDTTPPEITITYPEGGIDGWFNDPTTVGVRVRDEGTNGGASTNVIEVNYTLSGATVETGTLPHNGPGQLSITAEGSTQVDISAFDGNGNHATARVVVGLDLTPPAITFAGRLVDAAVLTVGEDVRADYSCVDARLGISLCAGDLADGAAVDTSRVGSFNLTVRGTDTVGNTTTSTIGYQVVPARFALGAPPTVSGPARIGHTLVATAPRLTPAPDRIGYQWLRNGSPIPGATGSRYRLLPADLGRRISVRVIAGRTGYIDHTQTSAASAGVAKAPATIRATVRLKGGVKGAPKRGPKRHRKVQVTAQVSAPGVPATGVVVVRRGAKVIARGTLRDGTLRLVVRKVPKNLKQLTVHYAGSSTVLPVTTTLRVPRR